MDDRFLLLAVCLRNLADAIANTPRPTERQLRSWEVACRKAADEIDPQGEDDVLVAGDERGSVELTPAGREYGRAINC